MAFLILLIFSSLVFLPQTDMAKTFLLEQAKQLIGRDIRVQKIDLSLLPTPRLQLVDIEINNVTAQLEYFNAKFLDVEILLLPLFLRTVVFKQLTLEQPEVTVRHLDEETVSSPPSPELQERLSQSLGFAFEHIAIRHGKLNLRQESKGKKTKDLQIEDILITLSPQNASSRATVQASAKTYTPKTGDSTLVVSGSITEQFFRHRIPILLGGNSLSLQFNGHAELSNFDLALVEKFVELGTGLEEFQPVVNLKTRFKLFPDKSGLTLVYSELEGTVGNISIRGKGSLSGLLAKDTTFFTSFSSSPISLRTLEPFMPVKLIPQKIRKTIEMLEIDGKVELINSIIAGSTAENIRTSIIKVVRISQGHVLMNKNTPPITNIEGTVVWDNGILRLDNFTGKYRSTHIMDGKGEIEFRESGPWANLQVSSHVNLQDILTAWSTLASPKELPVILKEVKGTGNVIVKVHGPLRKPKHLVFESIRLQNGNFLISHDLPPVHHVSGTMRVEKNYLKFSEFKAQHGPSKILNAAGTVQFRDTGPWALVEAETVFNIHNIKSLTAQLDPTFDIPPALKSLEGEGNLRLKLQGPLNDIPKFVVEHARLGNGRFKIHPDLPFIQHVDGTVSYQKGILRLTNFNTEFGESQIRETSGTVNFQGMEPTINLVIYSKVSAKDVVNLIEHLDPIPEFLRPVRNLEEVTGGVRLKAKLYGPLKHPEQLRVSSSEIHIENIGFRAPQASDPIEQLEGRILISHDILSISNFSGRMGESRASVGGTVNWEKGKLFQDLVFHANVESADIKKIQRGIFLDALEGAIELNGIVFGQRDSPRYRIQANLKEIDLKIPNVIHKPRGMSASFKVLGKLQHLNTIIVDQAEFHLPHVSLLGKGTIDTRKPLTISASMESTSVSLALIPEFVLFEIKKFQSGDLTLALNVEGIGTAWRGWNVNGSTRLNNVIIDDNAPDDPNINLSLDVSLTPEQDHVRFLMEAIPIKNIIPFLGITEYPIEGMVWGNGLLQGRIAPDQDLRPTLNGKIKLFVQKGRIYGKHALLKILSLMNFPSLISGKEKFQQDHLPFDTISADINVAKGIVHTENYVLKSPTVILSAVGNFDLPADQMDFVVAASPLGSHRKIVENVPLVNRLLEDELLVVFFKVKGPFNDPKVWPIRLEAVGIKPQKWLDQSMKVLKSAVSLEGEVESKPTKE